MIPDKEVHDSYVVEVASRVTERLGIVPSLFDAWPTTSDAFAAVVQTPKELCVGEGETVGRAELSHALNMILFARLLGEVDSAAAYVEEQIADGRGVFLDHGAVRTVAWPSASSLPQGRELIARVLKPLGYEQNKIYDLKRLKMTGFSYTHQDFPEAVGQWFVSEFHPDEFSSSFQKAVERTLDTAEDPLSVIELELLNRLQNERSLPVADSVDLLVALSKCFARIHKMPLDVDYELLLAESPEMAWISTEGTSCNHQTDRVEDLVKVAENEAVKARPIKDNIEVSSSGRVMQTAHKAPSVLRQFPTRELGLIERKVPGSFFEFIQRSYIDVEGDERKLDLDFDAANAQGIFKMTRTT